MKIKSLISNICAVSIVALSFVACSDYDNGFTEKEIAFQEAFKERFGTIDPEQDWNMATRGTLNISLNEEANVKIYSTNPISGNAVLMANYKGVSAPSALGFDMPKGTEQIFVQAISDRGVIVNGYYDIADNAAYVSMLADDETCQTTVGDGIDIDIYVDGSAGNVITKKYKLYQLNDVYTQRSEPWLMSEYRKILGKEEGVFAEGKDNWNKWIETDLLENDVLFTTSGAGEVSVTLNYRCTQETENQFAYFYYTGEEYPDPNNIKLFSLIPDVTADNDLVRIEFNESWMEKPEWRNMYYNTDWANGESYQNFYVQGTTFKLVYFGDAGDSSLPQSENASFDNSKASYIFEDNIHIGFAIVRVAKKKENGNVLKDENGNDIIISKEDINQYPYGEKHRVWFSIQTMNPPSDAYIYQSSNFDYAGEPFPAAATFNYDGVTYLGFEDWPENGGADLNDILFWVTGSFEQDIPELDDNYQDTEQSWVLSAEDLGDTDDIDYNDVVIRVEHTSGNDYIMVHPLAAGGTLASYVYFGDECVGEIHGMLDKQYKDKGILSGDFTPLNVSPGLVEKGDPIRVSVPEGFSLSSSVIQNGHFDSNDESDYALSNMGGFNIRVLQKGTVATDEDKIDSKLLEKRIQNSINESGGSEVPYVICTPRTWQRTDTEKGQKVSGTYRWAKESLPMTEAYNGQVTFRDWVEDKSKVDWYKYPDVSNTCSTRNVTYQSIEGGSTGGDDASKKQKHDITLSSLRSVRLAVNKTSEIEASSETGVVKYKSADTEIATVSDDGIITALQEGSTTITVYVDADDNYDYNYIDIPVTVIDQSDWGTLITEQFSSEWFTIELRYNDNFFELWTSNDECIATNLSTITFNCVKSDMNATKQVRAYCVPTYNNGGEIWSMEKSDIQDNVATINFDTEELKSIVGDSNKGGFKFAKSVNHDEGASYDIYLK